MKADTCPWLVFCIGFHEYQSVSRCSKLDVNRKWLADAKFHHSSTGRRNKRYDGEKGEELERISYGNGARIACPFNRKFSLIVSKNDVSKESVSIYIAISENVSRQMFSIYNILLYLSTKIS